MEIVNRKISRPETSVAEAEENQLAEALERVLQSRAFRRATRLKGLLRYVVSAAVNGMDGDERRTALEHFQKSEDFTPALDPVIRVQFGRLRKRLAQYYATEGHSDPVVIEIPNRSYTPMFHLKHFNQNSNGAGATGLVSHPLRTAQRGEKSDVGDATDRIGRQSVAVLPFANLTTDPKQDAFCYGLTEEIANALASVPTVNVVASSSSFQFRDEHVDVRDAARELGVLLILEGSVRVERGQARVTAQLARREDGVAIWSDSFDGKINGSLNTQRSLARRVLGSLPLGS